MKKSFLSVLLLSIFISAPVFADKLGWTGKEKATEEQKEAHKEAMKAKRGSENEGKEKNKEIKEQFIKKEGEPATGLEKQQTMKQEQMQKELGKGSEQGQESREPRKKWWKFWEK